MHPFLIASTWQRSAMRFSTTIDAGWFQGKGAFGGLLNAGILRSMMAVVDDERRRPRTFHAHFCAPARAGELLCDVVVERAGATISTLTARAHQEGGAVTVASATFGFPRAKPDDNLRFTNAPPPPAPPFADADATPGEPSVMPAFTQHFEYRMCIGDVPYSGSAEAPLIGGWLRFREPLDVVDAPAVAALIDAYPPALLPRLSVPRAASSVDLTVDFHLDEALTGAPILVRQTSRVGDGGYTDERGELWTTDGRLIATARQLVALL